jgi:hypothetical protein
MQPAQSNRASRIHRINNVACARLGFNRAQLPCTGDCRFKSRDWILSVTIISLNWLFWQNITRIANRADRGLIRMSGLYPKHSVITADKDFRVYRRNKREVIPTISPPRL